MKKALGLAVVILLSSCASLRSVSLTPIPKKRKNMVSAQASKWIIFGFNFDNDYADLVTARLMEKCNGKRIQGILTKDENFNYFIGLVMKRQITAKGYCV
ncbi:hypothetical protein [Pseudobacteriovorax antillogorgiicola]|uniref:Lipoprotein n=1 Tax=Pseudobacteriovorax antillogorgiicola TaxID=1513793 RepID=A0A1Y6CLK5_9BACT|nr:hypothetical protein [Pseudobacteriovorax antillogorgiicola]TCS47979.1 hypothetical protein EDD56_11990 [Pseudobacteriovorax antillogorgiicola]SMF58255.1 hypothetical protein SAMN06296036_11991 [Pseudobacteriovorax antillogorgiicola]